MINLICIIVASALIVNHQFLLLFAIILGLGALKLWEEQADRISILESKLENEADA